MDSKEEIAARLKEFELKEATRRERETDHEKERVKQHPLYKDAVSFWKSPAGKKAIRDARHGTT